METPDTTTKQESPRIETVGFIVETQLNHMKAKPLLIALMLFGAFPLLKAQTRLNDSATVAKTFIELVTICKTIDFTDPKMFELGTFYKAAPYIIYRGEDKKRSWKDFANYKTELEKTGVDNVCYKINNTVNQDSNYKILSYLTMKESEGIWYVLIISYVKKGVAKKSAFAFLKVNGRFGLGDID